jgi:hypothetical protein
MQGNTTAEQFYENRFLPEYRIAFDAWIKLDPFSNNSSAPPGPRYMPEVAAQSWTKEVPDRDGCIKNKRGHPCPNDGR